MSVHLPLVHRPDSLSASLTPTRPHLPFTALRLPAQIGAMRERLAAARGDESRRASEFALRVMQERHVVEQQVCMRASVGVCVCADMGMWLPGVCLCGYFEASRKLRK